MRSSEIHEFVLIAVLVLLYCVGAQGIASSDTIEFFPLLDGIVVDFGPEARDGIPDGIVEDGGVQVSLNPLHDGRGIIEFDLEFISPVNIKNAILKLVPIGASWPPGTETLAVQLFGFSGDGVIQLDDFDIGSLVTSFNVPVNPFVGNPIFLDVTDFLRNQGQLNFVGFNLRREPTVPSGGVNFGSLEIGPPATLTIEIMPILISIDIKPGGVPNSISCNNDHGVIPVVILTTDDFDATTADHSTVSFEGASETHVDRRSGEPRRHEEDVDGDGDIDLVFHFRLGETELDCGSTEGTLTGETFDGEVIEGTDSVNIIGS